MTGSATERIRGVAGRADEGAGGLEARGLGFRYPGADRDALDDVSLRAHSGQLVTVLGPNGSGKSTLLRLLAGGAEPVRGWVRLNKKALGEWRRRDIARHVGVVTQSEHVPFPIDVRGLVSMGRYPYVGPWRREGPADRRAVDRAMERCGVLAHAGRAVQTLSGGEMQRVRIARALAQEPGVLILDEPTASLDMHFEMTIFRLLRALAEDGVTVVVVTHKLNLAARFGDWHLLLDRGSVMAEGTSEAVIKEHHISRTYRWPVEVTTRSFREGRVPQVAPR